MPEKDEKPQITPNSDLSDIETRSRELEAELGGDQRYGPSVRQLLDTIQRRGAFELSLSSRVRLQALLDRWQELLRDSPDGVNATFQLAPLAPRFRLTDELPELDGRDIESLRSGTPLVGRSITSQSESLVGDYVDPIRIVDCRFDEVDLSRLRLPPGSSIVRTTFMDVCLDDAVIAGVSFVDCRLERSTLHRVQLQDGVITDSVLLDVQIEGADLDGAYLGRSRLERVTASSSSFCNASIGVGSALTDSTWTGVHLDGALLVDLTVRDATIRGATMRGARASRIDGRGLRLNDVMGDGSLFVDTPMAGLNFVGGSWSGTVFQDCDEMTRCEGLPTHPPTDGARRAVVPGPRTRVDPRPAGPSSEPVPHDLDEWEPAWIERTIRSGASVTSVTIDCEADTHRDLAVLGALPARFVDCFFEAADFRAMQIAPGTAFVSCGFSPQVSFAGATLDGVTFSDCFLDHSSFAGTSARGVRFSASVLRGCDLRGADLDGTAFGGSLLDGVEADHLASFRSASIVGGTVIRISRFVGSIFTGATIADCQLEAGESQLFDRCSMEGARVLRVQGTRPAFHDCDLARSFVDDASRKLDLAESIP